MQLEIVDISKTYSGGVKALQDVSLSISPGMFGLLGPNGAGKSSLMRTIATLQEPDAGTITFGPYDVVKDSQIIRQRLGYLPQEFGVYPKISAEKLLDYLAALKGFYNKKQRKQMIANLLALTNLSPHSKKHVHTFSGGMKQRFGIAQALIGNPQLIIVDEPTAGLDPEERVRFHNLLSEIGQQVTVILSTHIVEDVSDLCQNFAVIHGGKLLVQESPARATAQLQGKIWSKTVAKNQLEQVEAKRQVVSSRLSMGKTQVHIYADEDPGDGFIVRSEPALEDFYFSVIKGYLPSTLIKSP